MGAISRPGASNAGRGTPELLFRSQPAVVLDGQHQHTDTAIIRLPGPAAANAWHASLTYQTLISPRRQAVGLEQLVFTN